MVSSRSHEVVARLYLCEKPIKGADIIEFVSETVGDDLIEVCNAKVRNAIDIQEYYFYDLDSFVIFCSAPSDNVGMLVLESPSIPLRTYCFWPKELAVFP